MPSTITHAYFAMDVYNNLKDKDKIISEKKYNRLKMFAQSSDPLMFYNVFSILPGKNVRDFHFYFHTHDSRKFFTSLCKYIKTNNLKNNQDVMAFLYGFIIHYVLDSNAHPYVIYKTGFFDKEKESTYKYKGLHQNMETVLDNIMVEENEHINPYTFDLTKYCFDTSKFSNELIQTLDNTFKEVYDMNNFSKKYYKALKQMITFTKLFRKDKFGIKKAIYSTIDNFTSKKAFPLKALSYHTDNKKDDYYLNTKKETWYNSVDTSIESNESFKELYKRSIKEACNIIDYVNQYFNDNDIDLNVIFTNKSYITGLDCDIPLNFKKFAI